MKSLIAGALLALAATSFAATSLAATVGQPAPAFTITDTAGKTVSLSDFKGKTVVLEWINPDCPFVQKHYNSANMQGTQKDASSKNVVWLAVNSTARDHQDFKPPAAMAQWMQTQKATATATLMDPDGKLGKAYGARTTPHMYVVDPAGTLVYAGGIDSKPSANPADIPSATNYVKAALADMAAGKPISNANTKPYGCSVKYSSGA
jgi:peroxiredoxin